MTPISVQYLERFKEHHVHIRDAESWSAFQQLIQRGANLWPDAPPEIKEFADLVTNGKVMQDYYRQANKEQEQTK